MKAELGFPIYFGALTIVSIVRVVLRQGNAGLLIAFGGISLAMCIYTGVLLFQRREK